MRTTLRRSCDACAKAKHGCDLQTPRCSRCVKKNSHCVYANEPMTAGGRDDGVPPRSLDDSVTILNPGTASFDPFDSYPTTRLPRAHVQRLIHHFLSSIAFQYYPLDMNMESNPFVVSWWPLALADPALFHVSLQTACLDEELRAQKGFAASELLMVDSVSLVRRRIEDPSLAYQDETLDSVVTLAAIEHGKGNAEASRMHIEGVKQMVSVRGGIDEIMRTSPLTARMVSWVSMLVMESPQFLTQDDLGFGSGLGPILQWQLASTSLESQDTSLDNLNVDPAIGNILVRLRSIFTEPWASCLTNTDLHDLTCFVVHKLLLLPPVSPAHSQRLASSECLRYGMVLYMLIIHGTTYYSHFHLANKIIFRLRDYLETLTRENNTHASLEIWVLSLALVSTFGMVDDRWLMERARATVFRLQLHRWEDILPHLESILWKREEQEGLFRQKWEGIFAAIFKQVR